MSGKEKANAKIKTKKPLKIPGMKPAKTMQQSIPYTRVYDDSSTNGGIIEVYDGRFTKSYLLSDANYSDAGDDRQEEILKVFEKILNTFNPEYSYEITVNNRTIDQNEFSKKILIPYQYDNLDTLRIAHNELIVDKMQEGKNNLKSEKYLTIAVESSTIEEAVNKYKTIERDLNPLFKKINAVGLQPLSLKDRLEIMHDIYNAGKEGEFARIFDLQTIRSQGISTKDVIGPSSFDFSHSNYIKIGDTYARAMFLKAVPSILNSTFIESMSGISTNVLLSVHYEIQPQEKAVAFASAQATNIGGEIIKAQKKLSKSGASPELISFRLASAQKDAKELLADLTNKNKSLLHVTMVAVIFADNKNDLDLYTEQFERRAKENVCAVDVCDTQQEQGLKTALPLATNYFHSHRVMTSYSASAVQPFSTQEFQYKNGFYYGLNQRSKNLIIYNRGIANNQNGVILGSPGGGKSFAAKMEMYQAYFITNAQIFIIDPEQEYLPLGKALNATIYPIEPGGKIHINPLDLDITKDDDTEGDPFAQKIDFVISIIECMLGGKGRINGVVRGIIDDTLSGLYRPYIAHLKECKKTIDTETCPTLKDFYYALTQRKEPEARNLAAAIQIYCTGTLDLFAYHTNIDTDNRMIIYDIMNIGTNLMELGMQICLNDVWNRMISNKKRSVRTWFYIDEFYLLLQQPKSAQYLQMIWKRARKRWGTPTGITQNVSDLLATQEGVDILSTSEMAILLAQAPFDREKLADIYNISEEQKDYITTGNQGEGIIWTPRGIIPFENVVPESSPIYKLLSTKAKDMENLT